MGKRCYLTPFIQKVRRCQKCQRFGHVARICRTPDKNAVCQRCGKLVSSHGSSNNVNEPCLTESPSCINCKRHKLPDNVTAHEASSNSCPIFQKQRQIKKLMAFHGISQSEAMSMLESADPQSQLAGDNCSRSHPLPTLGEFLPYALSKFYAKAVSRNNHISHFNFSLSSSEVNMKRFPSIVKPQFSTDDLPAKTSANRKRHEVGSQHKSPGPELSLTKSSSSTFPPSTSCNSIQDTNINICPSNKTVNCKHSSIPTSIPRLTNVTYLLPILKF